MFFNVYLKYNYLINKGGGNNRQYFVLDQDNFTSINRASHLPIYHVLEQGYHVPSAVSDTFE